MILSQLFKKSNDMPASFNKPRITQVIAPKSNLFLRGGASDAITIGSNEKMINVFKNSDFGSNLSYHHRLSIEHVKAQ